MERTCVKIWSLLSARVSVLIVTVSVCRCNSRQSKTERWISPHVLLFESAHIVQTSAYLCIALNFLHILFFKSPVFVGEGNKSKIQNNKSPKQYAVKKSIVTADAYRYF